MSFSGPRPAFFPCTTARPLEQVGVDDSIVDKKAFGEEDIIEMNNGG